MFPTSHSSHVSSKSFGKRSYDGDEEDNKDLKRYKPSLSESHSSNAYSSSLPNSPRGDYLKNCNTRAGRCKKKLPHADYSITIISNGKLPCIEWIASGQKKAEGRVNGPFFKKINVGGTLCLHNRAREYVLCKILYKHEYQTFQSMIEGEALKSLLPATKTLSDGLKIYNSFPGAERVKQYGAVAIGLQPLESYLNSKGLTIHVNEDKGIETNLTSNSSVNEKSEVVSEEQDRS